jgi:ankyrin repeat protein
MRSLLDLGFDPNARTGGASTDPLMEYIAPGYAGRSANGQWHDVTPLMIATAIGDHRMMRMLLRAGADPDIQNDQGYTALMIAANLQGNLGAKRTQIASDLLSSGAKADAVSSADGSTALMFAAYNGYMEIVKLLLDHGAGTAHADRTGVTALDIARTRGHADIAELLRKRGQAPGH